MIGVRVVREAFRTARGEELRLKSWLEEARVNPDPSEQEDYLKKFLALRPGHAEAEQLLSQARTFKPILKRIGEAWDVRRRVGELRSIGQIEVADQLAADMAAVLEGSVLPDLLALPEEYPGRKRESEVRNLANFLRGRRQVLLQGVPPGAEVFLIFPMTRGHTALKWSEPPVIGCRRSEPASYSPLCPQGLRAKWSNRFIARAAQPHSRTSERT